MTQILDIDLVIVGGGIAGSALACALDGSGLKVLLLEAGCLQAEPLVNRSVKDFDPRVSALTHGSQAFFEKLGVWSNIVGKRVSPYTSMHVFDGEGRGEITFQSEEVGAECLGHIVENRVIIHALQQRLSFSSNVRLLENVSIEAIANSERGYRLTGNDSIVIDTKLLVGADGANSFVRRSLDFKTHEWDYDHHAIVCTVATTQSHKRRAWQSFTEHGPLAFLPLNHEPEESVYYSSIVWSVDPDEASRLLGLDDDDFKSDLSFGIEHLLGDVVEVSQRFSFPLRQRHAVNYTKKSVALVGDAAHTIHPLAGQGINLGLKDVMALAEEILSAEKSNRAIDDKAVLKRFERRRKGDNLSMMAVMEGFKRLYGQQDLLTRFVRNHGMRTIDAIGPVKNQIVKQAMGIR